MAGGDTVSVCTAGVALGGIGLRFAWQALHLQHWAGFSGAHGSPCSPGAPRRFGWQARRSVTLTSVSRGRRTFSALDCSLSDHFPKSPIPLVTISVRHHFLKSPLPLVTIPLCNHCPKTPLPWVITSLSHHFPKSPLPLVTSLSQNCRQSPLPLVTTSLGHHFPKSPLPLVATSLSALVVA